MTRPFEVPHAPVWVLREARVPACLIEGPAPGMRGREGPDREGIVNLDIVVDAGRFAAFLPAGTAPAELAGVDAGSRLLWPGLVDVHTHLDKGHIWPRAPNPDGTGFGAVTAVASDRAKHWTAEDVEARFEFAVRTAYAHGTVAIRTHLDPQGPQAAISFPVFMKLRDRWAGRIALQATSLGPPDAFLTDEGRTIADRVAAAGGQLGSGTRMMGQTGAAPPPAFDAAFTNLFDLAAERGLDLDLHVDESSDPEARALPRIAKIALAKRFKGRILVGHVCALALQDEAEIERTLELCAQAGIDIVSLPACNMYLQDRKAGRTPRWRGVTVLHEAKARGLRVAVAGDNVRDPFYAYGDHDMLETWTNAVRILQLDHPFADWPRAACTTPADIMKLPDAGRFRTGAPADFIVLAARSLSQMLSRGQDDRIVVRDGTRLVASVPDYRELDAVVGGP